MGPFMSARHGGYRYVSVITDQFSRWTAIYMLCSKDKALASLHAYGTLMAVPIQPSNRPVQR